MSKPPEKALPLTFHGRIIDSLGLHMYQKPVSAIAELIANAWDADAENVELTLPSDSLESSAFTIKDDGCGMTIEECEKKYLNVGWERRGDEPDARSSEKNRPILGRKGIGKFAGFGIAEVIHVKTIRKSTGELTEFQLDNRDLISDKYVSTKPKMIPVLDYKPRNKARRAKHGTEITLSRLKLPRALSQIQFAKSMARRFLLHQRQDDFRVLVNEEPLPETIDLQNIEYEFPRDYAEKKKPDRLVDIDDDGWGPKA